MIPLYLQFCASIIERPYHRFTFQLNLIRNECSYTNDKLKTMFTNHITLPDIHVIMYLSYSRCTIKLKIYDKSLETFYVSGYEKFPRELELLN